MKIFPQLLVIFAIVSLSLLQACTASRDATQEYREGIYKLATEMSDVLEKEVEKDGKKEIIKLDFAMTGSRGGADTEKPLGLYLGKSFSRVFKSEYTKVDPKVMASFACALNDFIDLKGAGLGQNANFVKSNIESDPDAVVKKVCVPYGLQEEFANKWWQENSKAFSSLDEARKASFIEESLLDATNLNMQYQRKKLKNGQLSALSQAVLLSIIEKR